MSGCFTAVLSMAVSQSYVSMAPSRRGPPKYIRLRESVFLISGEMGKKLLAANSTDRQRVCRVPSTSNFDVQL